jgi:hydrogenase assembly chaperone HypC/HupF
MCLTMPARVVELDGAWAVVEQDGIRRRASTLPAPDVQSGDWVIVAAGSVIRIVPPEVAAEISKAISVIDGDDPPRTEGDNP